MTPRKWFMVRQEFQKLNTTDIAHNIFNKNLPVDDVELYVFTEEELKAYTEELYCELNTDNWSGCDFEVYWQQKFGGGE